MRKFLFLFFLAIAQIYAQNEDYVQMIKTEFAFAESAAQVGVRQSFLNFIVDDGILFRPHPLKGKEFLEKSQPGSGYLSWYPSRSEMSAAGDLGYTTGPWSFRKAKDSSEIAFGEFCTVWQKQNSGAYKFVIDYGISHGKPVSIQAPLKAEAVGKADKIPGNPKSNLFNTGNELTGDIKGIYTEHSRLMVDGNFPFDGLMEIEKYLNGKSIKSLKYTSAEGKISKSNDLGFTYGSLLVEKNGENIRLEYYYFRVWRAIKDEWKVIAEVWNEKPKDKSN